MLQAGAVSVAIMLFLRESYAYVILQRKTSRLQKETGNPHLRSALDTGKNPKELFTFCIFRAIKMLFLSPIIFLMSVYLATVYAYLYLIFTTFPRVFIKEYGFSLRNAGLAHLGSALGCIIGLLLCGAVSDRLVIALSKRNGGTAKPEYRLPIMFIGALILLVGLFMYAWTAGKKLHWMFPIIGTTLLGAGMVAISVSRSTSR